MVRVSPAVAPMLAFRVPLLTMKFPLTVSVVAPVPFLKLSEPDPVLSKVKSPLIVVATPVKA